MTAYAGLMSEFHDTCEHCRWFDARECRRHASPWPTISGADWCGEFIDRERMPSLGGVGLPVWLWSEPDRRWRMQRNPGQAQVQKKIKAQYADYAERKGGTADEVQAIANVPSS